MEEVLQSTVCIFYILILSDCMLIGRSNAGIWRYRSEQWREEFFLDAGQGNEEWMSQEGSDLNCF